MMREGAIVNYYCYFEVKIDSGFDSEDCVEYSMGAIPARIAHNSDRLTSFLLLFFLVNNVFYQIEDIIFIWILSVKESNTKVLFVCMSREDGPSSMMWS